MFAGEKMTKLVARGNKQQATINSSINNQEPGHKAKWWTRLVVIALVASSLHVVIFGATIKTSEIIADKAVIPDKHLVKPTDAHKVEIIPLSNNSTIAGDISKILHNQREGKLTICFKPQRRCARPHLIGRLSGPALSTVKWDMRWDENEQEEAEDDLLINGSYHVPMHGVYFIEVIVLTCPEIAFDTDVRQICLEDPSHHRITKNNATITVIKSSNNDEAAVHAIGYWHYEGKEKEPLYTRYQHQICSSKEGARTSLCQEAVDLSRFENYNFKYTNEFDLKDHLNGKNGVVCFQGASHARFLSELSAKILNRDAQGENISCAPAPHQMVKWVGDFSNPGTIQNIMIKNCTKVVVGIGQWDASIKGAGPTSFEHYEIRMKKSMEFMVSMLSQENIELYFRTTQ